MTHMLKLNMREAIGDVSVEHPIAHNCGYLALSLEGDGHFLHGPADEWNKDGLRKKWDEYDAKGNQKGEACN